MQEQAKSRNLIVGMDHISQWFGLPTKKATRLAARGELPGVFKLGRGFFMDEAIANEELTAKARGSRVAA